MVATTKSATSRAGAGATCSAPLTRRKGLCRRPLGWGTEQPGDGPCRLHALESPAPVTPSPSRFEAGTVIGVRCARGHFNSTTAGWCATCGMSMLFSPSGTVRGTRPIVGVLVDERGNCLRLDGASVALQLSAEGCGNTSVRITIQEWSVFVMDLGCPGGVYLTAADAGSAVLLKLQEPVEITPGTHLTFGDRHFVFHGVTGGLTASRGAVSAAGADRRPPSARTKA